LYNEVTDLPYDAFFFDFKAAVEEKKYAALSVKNTKARLIPVEITDNNLRDHYIESINKLIYPVYDNGSALVGQIFMNSLGHHEHSNFAFIDGTLADSCYGVRNYNNRLVQGKEQSQGMSLLKEWIYSQGLLKGWGADRTAPRDSYLNDEFLQDLLWYAGPYANLWFKNAKQFTDSLKQKYRYYYQHLDDSNRDQYWPQYTVLKMLLYAAKQTSVKVYDMFLPHQVYFPFMFKTILDDQGKYTWEEKSRDNISKAPLKKILEAYVSKDFIYRKKVGLQSQTRLWLQNDEMKPFILDLIDGKDSVSKVMMGSDAQKLVKAFRSQKPPESIVSLVLSLSVIQQWVNVNKINIPRD
jgi:hypothetical protein